MSAIMGNEGKTVELILPPTHTHPHTTMVINYVQNLMSQEQTVLMRNIKGYQFCMYMYISRKSNFLCTLYLSWQITCKNPVNYIPFIQYQEKSFPLHPHLCSQVNLFLMMERNK